MPYARNQNSHLLETAAALRDEALKLSDELKCKIERLHGELEKSRLNVEECQAQRRFKFRNAVRF